MADKAEARVVESSAARPLGPVRVVIPASVAFDLGKFTKALGNLAERLGCRPCLSGADCTFIFERDFVVDPASLRVESFRGTAGGL
jgi:hypothetical protein